MVKRAADNLDPASPATAGHYSVAPVRLRSVVGLILILALSTSLHAQEDDRGNYPPWLERGMVEFAVGNIQNPFSSDQLEPGYQAGSVELPKLAARLALGHRLNDRLSAHLSYLRPVRWVKYRNVNGDGSFHSVWMNVLGVSVRHHVAFGDVSVYGEGGLGVITRHGRDIGDSVLVRDLVYVAPLVGGGAEYRITPEWALQAGGVFLPGRASARQPYTAFSSAGIVYRVQPRPRTAGSSVAAPAPSADRPMFREHLVQVGVATRALGTGYNDLMSPIFWEGDAGVRSGFTVDYQRNVFHTEKIFSLDIGAAAAYGESRVDRDRFVTLSMYPLMRLTWLRAPLADAYFNYSLAGPTYISKYIVDGLHTGGHFTFRDALGFGAYLGRGRHLNLEFRIAHYSNGNLLTENSGIQVPLILAAGYAF